MQCAHTVMQLLTASISSWRSSSSLQHYTTATGTAAASAATTSTGSVQAVCQLCACCSSSYSVE
eukprot:2332-Heterococcus_DN1.PRE.2